MKSHTKINCQRKAWKEYKDATHTLDRTIILIPPIIAVSHVEVHPALLTDTLPHFPKNVQRASQARSPLTFRLLCDTSSTQPAQRVLRQYNCKPLGRISTAPFQLQRLLEKLCTPLKVPLALLHALPDRLSALSCLCVEDGASCTKRVDVVLIVIL